MLQSISQSEFNQIEGARRIIVHDFPHQFAVLNLGEVGHYGLSWSSSSVIQPVTALSKDQQILWIGVDQRLAAISLPDGHLSLTLSLHTSLLQILPLDDCTVVLTELDVFLFNNNCSIRGIEGLPEIAADISVNGSDLVIRLIDDCCLSLNLHTLQLQEVSPISL